MPQKKKSTKSASVVTRDAALKNALWRRLSVLLLSVVGFISFISFMAVHWTHRQILTTENWVAMVGPLHEDEQVAQAISEYSVNKLFTATDLQNRIAEALPERASFLAAPLADQLQTRLTTRTKEFIQGDRFGTVWETINREASERMLTNARAENDQTKQTSFNIDLSSVRTSIRNTLGIESALPQSEESDPAKKLEIGVKIASARSTIRQYVKAADFLNATLGVLSLVCLVGAICLSKKRGKLVLIFGLVFTCIALLQLIGVKAFRPYLLNQVSETAFKPAVGVVYDAMLNTYRNMTVNTLVFGLIVTLVSLLLTNKRLKAYLRAANWVKRLKRTDFWVVLQSMRGSLFTYRRQIQIAIGIIGLVFIAFFVSGNWGAIVRALLGTVLLIEVVILLAGRKPVAAK